MRRPSGLVIHCFVIFVVLCVIAEASPSMLSAPISNPGRDPEGRGGGEFVFHDTDHLTEAQREAIWKAIRDNIRRLEAEGALPAPSFTHPLLAWPLRAAPSLTDPGYHGTSNFVDQNPSYPNQLRDYACGSRTYDNSAGYNHSGIDYFTWPFGWQKMDNSEVEIVAAAPGIIIFKSDGYYDRSCAQSGGNWNAVYVRHADNSVAWYGHMKRFSLTPKGVGFAVAQGEYLGVVGSSGNSSGPHLHLEVYNSTGALNEPHTGPCNAMNPDGWWQAQKPYYDSALNRIATNFAPPDFSQCPYDVPNEANSFSFGDTVYFMSYYRDQLAGQVAQYRIYDPNGQLFSSWSFSSPASHYAASYWYWYFTDFAPFGPAGTWRFEVTYQTQTLSHTFTMSPAPAAGRVPDHQGAEPPLLVTRGSGPVVTLTWGASCQTSDTDYEVYEGDLEQIYYHEYQLCSTGGATTANIIPYYNNSYFLVVPTNGLREGSYGRDSSGAERPQGWAICRPQLVDACP